MSDLPRILIVRHPDHPDDFTIEGEVDVIYLDLGSAFDITRLDPGMADYMKFDVREWVADHRAELNKLPLDCDVQIAGIQVLKDVLDAIGDTRWPRLPDHAV